MAKDIDEPNPHPDWMNEENDSITLKDKPSKPIEIDEDNQDNPAWATDSPTTTATIKPPEPPKLTIIPNNELLPEWALESDSATKADEPSLLANTTLFISNTGAAFRDVIALPFDIMRAPFIAVFENDSQRRTAKLTAIGSRIASATLTILAPIVTLATGIAAPFSETAKDQFYKNLPRLMAFTAIAATALTGGIAAAGAGAIATTVAAIPYAGPAIAAITSAAAPILTPVATAIAPAIVPAITGVTSSITTIAGIAGTSATIAAASIGVSALAITAGAMAIRNKIIKNITTQPLLDSAHAAITPAPAALQEQKKMIKITREPKGKVSFKKFIKAPQLLIT